jgi:hypothetical protein
MEAPAIFLLLSLPLKWTSSSLPKREELGLRRVLALPNASRMGLVCRVCVCGVVWGSVRCGAVRAWVQVWARRGREQRA